MTARLSLEDRIYRRRGVSVLSDTRVCLACDLEKPLTEFVKCPNAVGGRTNRCMTCKNKQCSEYRSRPEVKKRDCLRQRNLDWDKRHAAKLVQGAIRTGSLVRKPCEVCSRQRSQAHHDDYNLPLAVRWLCSMCHRTWHLNHEPVRAAKGQP